jgi:hypothetical protein
MKRLLTILFLIISIVCNAQLPFNPVVTQTSTGNFKWGWPRADSGFINAVRDTFNARYSGSQIIRIQNGDTSLWFGAGGHLWFKNLQGKDTNSLSTRINFKLNTIDTTNKWIGLGRRIQDTMYRINDSTIGYTINQVLHTIQILGRSQGGGGGSGTVTSVNMSVPAALTVSGGPITGAGTFNLSGAGNSGQYIKGNGTLGTTDTSMITNFYLKSRGLLSGNSPLSYNNITGIFSIQNANTTGQKGAATFVNASFSDNGSGLIDLADVVTGGVCSNCNVTFDSKGRATTFTDGTGASVNARRSVTKATLDSLQLVNDTTLNVATGRKYDYQLDTTGRRAYYEDKYVIGKNYGEIRGLRLPDTSYVFRANSSQIVGDYVYDPTDVTTTDDTVVTIVSGTYRYKRYIPDGVYDPHWWGAKANGTYDDTWAVQQAINAANKYTGNNGTVIRLTGNYKFDPSNFVYNTGRGMVFEITGNVQLLNTWRITRGVSIIGKGGATAEASFAWSNIASIQYTVVNTGAPKAAVELTYGGNTLRNLTIGSYGGIGVKLNGTFFIPAALALLDNVSASVGSYTGKQTGLLVSDWFWFKLDNCSFSVDGTSAAGSSSIKLEGKTYFPDINLCYLGEFNNCTAQGRPIRIQAGDTADASLNVGIVNITFRNLTIENIAPDTAAIMLNSTRIPIDNIVFERPVMVDTYNMGFFIYNYGNNTSGVKLHDGDLLSGQLKKIFGGAAIVNKYFTSTAKPINNFVFNPNSRQLYDDFGINGFTDNINMNRGWKPPLELQLYDGGQIARNAARLKDSVITSASVVTEPFTGYNGDTVAIKVTPDGTNSNPTIQIKQYEQVWHTGDQIYFGAWVKSDYMDSIFSTALKAQIDGGYLWQNTSSSTLVSDITYISQPNNGWRFLICSGLIDASASDHSSHKMYLYINSNDTNRTHPYYVSHAFAYKIDSATAINQNEFLSWVKMNAGGLYAVPSKSYGIRDDLAFYIGDSTRFLKGVLQRMDGTGTWQSVGGGGGGITLAPIGSSPNANGASFSSGTLTLQPANASFGGVVTTASQTFAGTKTFNNEIIVSGNTPNNPTGLFGNMNIQSFQNLNGFVANNLYYNNGGSGYTYLQNGQGAQFHFSSGDILFETAGTGTAGGAASPSTIMQVTNPGEVWTSGSMSVGSLASPVWKLDVNGPIRSKSATAGLILNNRGTNVESIMLYSPSGGELDVYDWTTSATRFTFLSTGQLQLNNYGSGAFPGTPTHTLQSTSDGHIIEGALFVDSAIWKNDGTMTANHTLSGNSKILNIGASGSKLTNLYMYTSSTINMFGGVVYGTDASNTDANYTVPNNVIIAELSPSLSTNRTLTLPTATLNGTMVTLVMRYSTSTNVYNLSAAVTDNATGTTFTQLDWGHTYDFYYDQGLSWRLIRKY